MKTVAAPDDSIVANPLVRVQRRAAGIWEAATSLGAHGFGVGRGVARHGLTGSRGPEGKRPRMSPVSEAATSETKLADQCGTNVWRTVTCRTCRLEGS